MTFPTPTQTWPAYTFRAMGCQISLWLEADLQTAYAAFAQAEALFNKNERALSRFLPDSELNRLNGRSGQWTQVSDLLWHVLNEAFVWAKATDGLFDPTLLNALEAAGYTQSFEKLTAVAGNGRLIELQHEIARSTLGQWATIRLNQDNRSVWLPQGVKIDLGGIVKGYTAQQAVDVISDYGSCLLDAGGDLTAGNPPIGLPGWPVGIAAPWTCEAQTQENLATLWLANGSLATSGIDYRRWEVDGRLAHHLIDPRTNQPAQTNIITTTVLAEDATEAEAWATATLILGSTLGLEKLAQHPALAAALVTTNEQFLLTPAMRRLTKG